MDRGEYAVENDRLAKNILHACGLTARKHKFFNPITGKKRSGKCG
jgi:hypothetical protein